MGFIISMRAFLYDSPISIGMGLRSPALRAGEAPLSKYDSLSFQLISGKIWIPRDQRVLKNGKCGAGIRNCVQPP